MQSVLVVLALANHVVFTAALHHQIQRESGVGSIIVYMCTLSQMHSWYVWSYKNSETPHSLYMFMTR